MQQEGAKARRSLTGSDGGGDPTNLSPVSPRRDQRPSRLRAFLLHSPRSSRPHATGAAGEEVAQRGDERPPRFDFDRIEAELREELAAFRFDLFHRLRMV